MRGLILFTAAAAWVNIQLWHLIPLAIASDLRFNELYFIFTRLLKLKCDNRVVVISLGLSQLFRVGASAVEMAKLYIGDVEAPQNFVGLISSSLTYRFSSHRLRSCFSRHSSFLFERPRRRGIIIFASAFFGSHPVASHSRFNRNL
jgi:hypothetical protein